MLLTCCPNWCDARVILLSPTSTTPCGCLAKEGRPISVLLHAGRNNHRSCLSVFGIDVGETSVRRRRRMCVVVVPILWCEKNYVRFPPAMCSGTPYTRHFLGILIGLPILEDC